MPWERRYPESWKSLFAFGPIALEQCHGNFECPTPVGTGCYFRNELVRSVFGPCSLALQWNRIAPAASTGIYPNAWG